MFTGLGAREVSPNPFCLGIIWAGPSEQVSTPGRFRATRLLVVPGRLNCRLLIVETFSKEDGVIFKDTFHQRLSIRRNGRLSMEPRWRVLMWVSLLGDIPFKVPRSLDWDKGFRG